MKGALKKGLPVLMVSLLVACGGGGGDNYVVGVGTHPNDGSDTTDNTTDSTNTDTTDNTDTTVDSRIADLEIATSSRQLGTNGATPVIISAVVKDANNNILKDVDVQFAVDNNATIEPDEGNSGTTDATGVVTGGSSIKTARLTPGLNRPENRTLTVTVTAGTQVRTLEVEVTGTTVQLDGPERIVINTPTQFVAKLKDSTGQGLPHQVVNISSSSGSTIEAEGSNGFYTDDDGELSFLVTAGLSGADTITATALGDSFDQTVSISGDEFALSSANVEIPVNSQETVSLIWKHNTIPQVNKTITLAATRGSVPGSVVTDSKGEASFTMTSSTAGGSVVTAIDTETGLTASIVREFVAISPDYLSVQSERSNIGPEEQTTIIAMVRDINDNPVKNQKVKFNIEQGTVNGELSSSTATTDSLGRATVVYTAGNGTSAKDGVKITAVLQENPSVTSHTLLTVGGRALRIVLGTDEETAEQDIYYKKSYGVVVTDSGGNPVAEKEVNFTLIPTYYLKGQLLCDAASNSWQMSNASVMCPSEDRDNDGKMDMGEDYNGNGLLEPTHPASINTRAITDVEGKATVVITYPQSEALWSQVRLVATVSDEGTEYFETAEFILPVLADDVSSCDVSPPNQASPYGVATSCEDWR